MVKDMKRGYTLIELIILVIILSLIGIVTIPLVLSKINDARYDKAKSNAYEVISSAKLYHYNKLVTNNGIFNEVTFNCDGKCKYLNEELDMINNPNSGTINIKNDGTITGELSFYEGDYIFYVCNDILYEEKVNECLPSNNLTLQNRTYNTTEEVLYAGLLWNVVKDNGDNVTLVLKNIIDNGSLGSKKYNYVESDVNNKLNEWLENNMSLKLAKEQNSLVLMKFSVSDNDYESYIRIPSKDDVGVVRTTDKCSTKWCNINKDYWLYNYLISYEGIYKVYNIDEEGITRGSDISNELGIRPIIIVKKH